MRIDVLTLFPAFFDSPFSITLLDKAVKKGRVELKAVGIRDFAEDKHHITDDTPYGGGEGMVLKPEPVAKAISHARLDNPKAQTILLTPQGRRLDQDLVEELAHLPGLILVCGRYEGTDARIAAPLINREISVGDFILAGGEAAALCLIEAVCRLIPDVVGNEDSVVNDTFPHRLKYPQYTRPREFEGQKVPEVLLSGDHEKIEIWRKREGLKRTLMRRPDLLDKYPPDPSERKILAELGWKPGGGK